MRISAMEAADWPRVRAIYEEGLATGAATFETEAPEWEDWNASHLAHSRLLLRTEVQRILGWAALSPVSDRCAYGGVAEVSVYVGESARGEGVGRTLLEALIESSEAEGIWTLQAGIFADNEPSRALFEHCGFRSVGVRERLGRLNDAWVDVLLMERRSKVVG